MCETLGIKKLKTTAYHPQTNGILERWHGSLKGMLRKLSGVGREWDSLLKFCLMCYRGTPHTATGFSLYELVHGYQMRGPLEAIKEGWIKGELSFTNTVQWVTELRETLTRLYEEANQNEGEYKGKSKLYYDKKSKDRSFQPGDMVLLHTPSLTGKLNSIWDGPYEVTSAISRTVYKIAVPHSKSSQNIHINRLKPWHTPSANLFRVAVGQDSVGSEESPGRVALGQSGMAEAQKLELGKGGVVCERLGQAIGTEHEIDTGQSPPVQAYSYRTPPNWKRELHGEIKKLLDDEIIAPITCPWSAPMVLTRKTDGSLRLCIDYRKLNKATVSDPYQMPRVDDLLDSVAEARWLSKLDLKKGFYQISMLEGNKRKTAFCMPWGKFAFQRIPFGLKNAPATFQRCMDAALAGQTEFSSAYIDDVLIYSASWEEHVAHVRAVLGALRKAGLTANPAKCQWRAHTLTYLGYEVGVGKLSIPEARIKAIQDYRWPSTKTGLKSFLGTTGYYWRFFPHYARKAGPLYHAPRKVDPPTIWVVHSLI